MKRKTLFSVIAVALIVTLTSCDLLLDFANPSSSSTYDIVTATQSKTWTYDSDYPICEVSDKVLKLTINNIPANKNFYMVLVNPNDYVINQTDYRVIQSVSSRAVTGDYEQKTIPQLKIPEPEVRYFVQDDIPLIDSKTSFARTVVSDSSDNLSKMVINHNMATRTTKNIYVDTTLDEQNSPSDYKAKSATLYATGTNCYVWIVDDFYSSSAGGNKVNSSLAATYAEKFDDIYPYITNVFGSESDEILNVDEYKFVDMDTVSDTGTKVNIVIYDIGNDYNLSKEKQCGVVGYFYQKDYRYSSKQRTDIIGKSNVGKYFYIDSGFANSSLDTTISTLAHEFQHMINYSQKEVPSLKKYFENTLPYYERSDTNYNEMLSMLCEDMMQTYLGLKDKDSPLSRISTFNAYYTYSGIREYRSDKNTIASYANAYTFGSWLARQYGGAKLINEISTNSFFDNESLVAAVNTVNGTTKTFDNLFEEFLLSIVGLPYSCNATYTHNQDADKKLSYSSYYYPMKAFNIRNQTSPDGSAVFSITDLETDLAEYVYSDYTFLGPLTFSSKYGPQELRPNYGISIHGIEKTSAATSKTYTFSSSGAEGLRLYIIIQ